MVPRWDEHEDSVVPLVAQVVERLSDQHETIAFAESCTGGRASDMLTSVPGVSAVYLGSVIAYADAVKEALLGVPESLLRAVGAVSAPVAMHMAKGARRALHTTWAVSMTGIAGPGGGSVDKPVGTVFFGVSGPGVEETEQMVFAGTRAEIQQASADYAFVLLWRHLQNAQ